MNEKIYYIPKNLNSEWLLIGCFGLMDAAILLMTFVLAVFITYFSNSLIPFLPWSILLVLRIKTPEGYTVGQTLVTWLRYFYNRKSRTYILFEKERSDTGGDDGSAES